jgi:hypothetical protein
MSKLVSPSKVKALALEIAARHRPTAGFARVSKEFVDAIEQIARKAIADRVQRHPSLGITLR